MKFAWIKEHRDSFPVSTMCRVFDVSSSGFYKWLHGKPGQRTQRTEAIKVNINSRHPVMRVASEYSSRKSSTSY